MGGFGAARLGFYYHRIFSRIISLSGAFIIDQIAGQKAGYKNEVGDYDYYRYAFGDLDRLKNSPKDPIWCAKQAADQGDAPEIYMACGEDDFLIQENRSTKVKLEEMGISLQYLEASGSHDWNFWNQHLEPAVRWLLK